MNVKSKVSFEYSTEGADLLGAYSLNDEIQYLGVSIYGEMGKKVHEYSFTENSIIYSCTEIAYAEPFYMDAEKLKIKDSSHKRYLISNGQMYECSDEFTAVSKEFQDETIARMFDFIETLNEKE